MEYKSGVDFSGMECLPESSVHLHDREVVFFYFGLMRHFVLELLYFLHCNTIVKPLELKSKVCTLTMSSL